MFDKNCKFASERLLYRGIKEDDAEKLVRWRSREDVYRYFDNPSPISLSEHLSWFRQYMQQDNELRTIIAEKKVGKEIGMVGGLLKGSAFVISYYIGEPEFRGKGYAGESIEELIRFVQNVMSVRLYQAHVHKDNTTSISCLSRIGFSLLMRTESSCIYEYSLK